jgi:hypothetical protein
MAGRSSGLLASSNSTNVKKKDMNETFNTLVNKNTDRNLLETFIVPCFCIERVNTDNNIYSAALYLRFSFYKFIICSYLSYIFIVAVS